MQLSLNTPFRKTIFLGMSLGLASVYGALATRQFLAAHYSKTDIAGLEQAARLSPGNADYQHGLGVNYFRLQLEPARAVQFLTAAIGENPNKARYWLDLSAADETLQNQSGQKYALERAVLADPTNPDVAWEAGNIYWTLGDYERALQEFRIVLDHSPYLLQATIEDCWRIRPDVDSLLRDVVPHRADIYSLFLDFLLTRRETEGAAKLWAQLVQLQQPVERRVIFNYVQYLIDQHNSTQAQLVWRQASGLSNLWSYQPSPGNLIVNGNFSQPILNAGFDWLYQKEPDVALAVDSAESQSGHSSLSMVFNSRGMEDAGIRQLIPVEPNSNYAFTAYFKAKDLQGVGGPRFVIEDAFAVSSLFASDQFVDTPSWQQVAGTFTTSSDTSLVLLRVQRNPAGKAIRGKVWIDDIRLVEIPAPRGTS